jgi:hypothetical protein
MPHFTFDSSRVCRLARIVGGTHQSAHENSYARSFGNVATTGHTDFEDVVNELGIMTVPEEGEDELSSDDGETLA